MLKNTHKQKILDYLVNEPRFRERKNKDRGIVNLLMERYPALEKAITDKIISKELMSLIVQDYASMDRQWRKLLEEKPELRGTDYGNKEELEMEVQRKLGYPI
jgi:hypothetical protein